MIYFLGGVSALWLSPIYAVLIHYVGAGGRRSLPYVNAGLCGIMVAAMACMEYFGVLPGLEPSGSLKPDGRHQAGIVLTVIAYFYVAAFASTFLDNVLKKSKKKLLDKNRELESRTRELQQAEQRLREAHLELEKRVEERTSELLAANRKLIIEIEERSRGEARLRKSRREYKELADSITDVFFALDREMRITFWNRESERITGTTAQDVLGTPLYEAFPEIEAFGKDKVFSEIMERETPGSFVERMVFRGKLCFIEVNVYPSKDGLAVFARDITGKYETERALRESEERYRLIFENVSEVIYSVDSRLKVLSVSPSVERLLGYKPEEFVGKSFHELNILVPEYREQALRDARRVFASERIESAIYEFVARDGTIKTGDVSGAPVIHDGEVVALISVGRDITDRLATEKALKESEGRFRAWFEFAPDAYFITDLEGTFIDANKSAEELLGYGKEELIGENYSQLGLFALEFRSRIEKIFREILDERPSKPEKIILRKKDGRRVLSEIRTIRTEMKGAGCCTCDSAGHHRTQPS